MAAVTICNDFGAQKYRVYHCFHCFLMCLLGNDGPDAMIFVFWMLTLSQFFHPPLSLSSRGSLLLLRLGPNPMTSAFIRKGERDRDRHKETQERKQHENTDRQEQCTYKPRNACCQVASVVPDSVRPHRRQPTRLPRPWDSPGKNTGVGCHFLLQCVKSEKWKWSCSGLATPWNA